MIKRVALHRTALCADLLGPVDGLLPIALSLCKLQQHGPGLMGNGLIWAMRKDLLQDGLGPIQKPCRLIITAQIGHQIKPIGQL